MIKFTREWLEKHGACTDGKEYALAYGEANPIEVARRLVKDGKLDWANWLIIRLMNHKQKIQYAVYAAEQVIDEYEKRHPGDVRPRAAIEAAKAVVKNPSQKNKNAAYAAANAAADAAADAAAYAAYAAAYAAYAAYAADAAAYAADAAAYAAYAANAAANAAADAAADAAAYAAMKRKIIDYGIRLVGKN